MSKKIHFQSSRRKFIYNVGLTVLSAPAISSLVDLNDNNFNEERNQQYIKEQKAAGKLGIALVGLGSYAGGQLAPALLQTEQCYLAGIVTGTPSKIETWKSKYNVADKNVYNYDNFDGIINNPDIDIVYVVLPNSMHAEYVIRAAQAGKHVITEKPMATSVEDCDKMIAACKKAGKMLSVGYRLHFEPYNLEMARLGTQKVFGDVQKVKAGYGFNIQPGVWRLNKKMAGGGPLEDVGVYCIQAVCYTTGMDPVAVTAQEGPKTDMERFKEVEQSLNFQMEMPDGSIGECHSSYSEGMNYLHADAKKGWFELTSAYNYSGQKGGSANGPFDLPKVIQQAKQMDDFALAIKNKRPSPVPGEMGRRDVKIITAIYEAMNTRKRIEIPKG